MTATTAPLWRRFAALLYDSFLLAALSFAYGAACTAISVLLFNQGSEDYQPMFGSAWFGLGWIFTLLGFYWYFWLRFGQTLGMKTWRLQLVEAQAPHGRPSVRQVALRSAVGVPSLALLGLGYFYKYVDSNEDCLHDKASGTKVVLLAKAS